MEPPGRRIASTFEDDTTEDDTTPHVEGSGGGAGGHRYTNDEEKQESGFQKDTNRWQEKQIKRGAARDNYSLCKSSTPGVCAANVNLAAEHNQQNRWQQKQGKREVQRDARTAAVAEIATTAAVDSQWQRKERKRITNRDRNLAASNNDDNGRQEHSRPDQARTPAIIGPTGTMGEPQRSVRPSPAQGTPPPPPLPPHHHQQQQQQQQPTTPHMQDTFLLPVANQIENGDSMLVTGEAQPVDQERLKEARKERRRRFVYWVAAWALVLSVMVVVIVVVVLTVAINKDNDKESNAMIEQGGNSNKVTTITPTSSPSDAPSAAPTSWLPQDLPYSTLQAIQDSLLSPQGRAFEWLSSHPVLPNMTDSRKTQLLALATFYYAMNGENWPDDIQRTWMQYDVHECNWYSDKYTRNGLTADDLVNGPTFFDPEGVDTQDSTCFLNGTHAGEMYYFGLAAAHGIQGTVPPEIALLSNMEVYVIDQSSATGDISDYVVSELLLLPQLKSISLFYNVWINGSFPDYFWSMSKLEEISLFINKVSGTLATEIGFMTSMESFSLNNNFLSGTIPTEIGLLSNLQNLGLMYNNLSGTLPSELGLLTKLTQLFLRDNDLLSGTVPTELEALPQLEEPNFADTGVTGGASYGSTP